jgi:hydroxymethylpyrimidine pyrophosphatase-like HAD family hydrolase
MRYLALACDYDGTIAHNGRVNDETIEALQRVRDSGRRLILVSGRELEDIENNFDRLDLFDRAVLENGALLYRPQTKEEKVLAERPPDEFVRQLERRGVGPISFGRVIVATWVPHENAVLDTIRDMGLELQVIFNKGAVMVLPAGVNKATGLTAALAELELSPHNCAGVGDAENDHTFLNLCEAAVAVSNALPTLKERADWVTIGDHGTGVRELVDRLLESDLSELESDLSRYSIPLGMRSDGSETYLRPYGVNVLLAGSSQGGKTTLATGVIERLIERAYQLCVIDPEGDYSEVDGVVVLGDGSRPPATAEVLEVLRRPEENLVVNLLGITLQDRPPYFVELFSRLIEMRVRTGRPHWLFIDESHHLFGAAYSPAKLSIPGGISGVVLITVEPEHVSAEALAIVDVVIAIGDAPERIIRTFCEMVKEPVPTLEPVKLEKGDAIVWSRRSGDDPIWIRTLPTRGVRRRHVRKYAVGELAPEISFYFRGAEGKLNLRAQNLMVFLQLAEGVDDETWLFHLRNGEYTEWFRDVIKDESLAEEAERVEKRGQTAAESRAAIKAAIEKRYTAPA